MIYIHTLYLYESLLSYVFSRKKVFHHHIFGEHPMDCGILVPHGVVGHCSWRGYWNTTSCKYFWHFRSIFIINDGAFTKNCAIYGNIVFCKIAFPKLFIRFFSRGVNFWTLLLFLEHCVVVLVLLVMHKKIERASIMGKWLVHTRTLKSFNFQIEFMFLLPPQIIIKRKTFIRIHHHIYTLTRHTSNTIYLLSVIETIYTRKVQHL